MSLLYKPILISEAWARGQALCVHGWVYSLGSGLVTDLDVTVAGPAAQPPITGQ